MTAADPPVTVLTSGVGLGVYVPALLDQRALRSAGRRADVEVLEGWFTPEHLDRHLAHRRAYREDFRLALLAHRATRDVTGALDDGRLAGLLGAWAAEGRDRFLVWSGFWLPVLQRYVSRVPHLAVEVDLCRIDAVVSASFRVQRPLEGARGGEVWLWNWPERRLGRRIEVSPEPPVPLDARDRRVVVHGGGWGLGTYLDTLPELAAAGYGLDVVVHDAADWPEPGPRDRRFRPDPAWQPWHRDAGGDLRFPPLAELRPDGRLVPLPDDASPPVHDLVRAARAIVSKPGGGTLVDSLDAATPVVLLEPYGDAEACNGALWEHLGFGVRLERWRATGFDPAVLAALHRNLLAARSARPTHALEGARA